MGVGGDKWGQRQADRRSAEGIHRQSRVIARGGSGWWVNRTYTRLVVVPKTQQLWGSTANKVLTLRLLLLRSMLSVPCQHTTGQQLKQRPPAAKSFTAWRKPSATAVCCQHQQPCLLMSAMQLCTSMNIMMWRLRARVCWRVCGRVCARV